MNNMLGPLKPRDTRGMDLIVKVLISWAVALIADTVPHQVETWRLVLEVVMRGAALAVSLYVAWLCVVSLRDKVRDLFSDNDDWWL